VAANGRNAESGRGPALAARGIFASFAKPLLSTLVSITLMTGTDALEMGDPSVKQRDTDIVLKRGAAMTFQRDVPITLRDGHVVYANIYRPKEDGRYPVLLAQTVYGKDPNFRDVYKARFDEMLNNDVPNLCEKSSCNFIKWEVTDPERWIPEKYAVMVVDVRGSGKSPGLLDSNSPRETSDFYDVIEWAGVQAWSNGKVGLLGISYMAINQWQVAALQPPHLAAIAPWEGASDFYREIAYHGGILSNFFASQWAANQISPNIHGNGKTSFRDPDTGEQTTGSPVADHFLIANQAVRPRRPLEDEAYLQATPVFSRIEVPLLSAGNWGGMGLHGRGNIEGYLQAGSTHKWLEIHSGTHDKSFYSDAGFALQKRFFDHYLKGIENGWERSAPVTIAVRTANGERLSEEQEWPLARTRWTNYYLDASTSRIAPQPPGQDSSAVFAATRTALVFSTAPLEQDTEFTGPLAAHLWISSSTSDADLFLTFQAFDAAGREVTFVGASDPAVPVAQGWLRASHRALDAARSLPYRPWHSHQSIDKLEPGKIYGVDVEIWPTSMVFAQGSRMVLRIEGNDFARPGTTAPSAVGRSAILLRGSGPFLHTDPIDRPVPEFAGETTILTGPTHESFLTMPLIPADGR
jgi:predicted acyl esterase